MNNVLEWLEASAERSPEALSFADDVDQVTFGALLDHTRAIGSFIAARLDSCRPIAVLSKKSPWAMAAMLGAVQARCFYCVLDERSPDARLANILDTLQPGLLFTDGDHYEQASNAIGSRGIELVRISEALDTPVDDALLSRRRAGALDTDPLYVNFTSGSTGTPKGVVVGHRSVIDFIGEFTKTFGIRSDDRIANQAPFDFDVSVKDIYSGLAMGASVHLIPRDFFSIPTQLMDFLGDREVTVCTWAVSAMCFVSIMKGFGYREVPSIRLVIFSGEVMPPKQLAVWQSSLPDATFVNVYGPTEVTCNCTYFIVDRKYEKDEVIPIGKPFRNEKVFLLDEDDNLVASPDQPGEICVGGSCLALGYCNDPEKTAAVFVQNPLQSVYRDLVYRTGDLARYNEAGDLVYIGRKDHQIKHMGQRIELGEIEAIVQGLPDIDRACCIYNERRKRILLYYAGKSDKAVLLEQLKDKLPPYMMPNKVHQVDAMPLTKNGKIDRAKLAELA